MQILTQKLPFVMCTLNSFVLKHNFNIHGVKKSEREEREDGLKYSCDRLKIINPFERNPLGSFV